MSKKTFWFYQDLSEQHPLKAYGQSKRSLASAEVSLKNTVILSDARIAEQEKNLELIQLQLLHSHKEFEMMLLSKIEMEQTCASYNKQKQNMQTRYEEMEKKLTRQLQIKEEQLNKNNEEINKKKKETELLILQLKQQQEDIEHYHTQSEVFRKEARLATDTIKMMTSKILSKFEMFKNKNLS